MWFFELSSFSSCFGVSVLFYGPVFLRARECLIDFHFAVATGKIFPSNWQLARGPLFLFHCIRGYSFSSRSLVPDFVLFYCHHSNILFALMNVQFWVTHAHEDLLQYGPIFLLARVTFVSAILFSLWMTLVKPFFALVSGYFCSTVLLCRTGQTFFALASIVSLSLAPSVWFVFSCPLRLASASFCYISVHAQEQISFARSRVRDCVLFRCRRWSNFSSHFSRLAPHLFYFVVATGQILFESSFECLVQCCWYR